MAQESNILTLKDTWNQNGSKVIAEHFVRKQLESLLVDKISSFPSLQTHTCEASDTLRIGRNQLPHIHRSERRESRER